MRRPCISLKAVTSFCLNAEGSDQESICAGEGEKDRSAMHKDPARKSRWYFGGLASMGAACCTHPLDLIKVHLQTANTAATAAAGGAGSSSGQKGGIYGTVLKVYRSDGIRGFYSGLSASLLRQASYSTTRFALYEVSTMVLSFAKALALSCTTRLRITKVSF